jgi:hypothetical protein
MNRQGKRLGTRLAVQVAIGLATGCKGGDVPKHLRAKAKAAGLTGAEIMAATGGGSFYLRDSAAVSLARAVRDGVPGEVARCRKKASDAGLSADEVVGVERMANDFLARHCT